jgi:hypothetical protein
MLFIGYTMCMNKTIATKWVKALRSGKYKQGEAYLCQITNKGKKHCCLGVLTEMYQAEQKAKKKKVLPAKVGKIYHDATFDVVKYGSGECAAEELPVAVKRWAGMGGRLGEFDVESDGYFGSLSHMNDDGCSFKKIANFIEKNYENL